MSKVRRTIKINIEMVIDSEERVAAMEGCYPGHLFDWDEIPNIELPHEIEAEINRQLAEMF